MLRSAVMLVALWPLACSSSGGSAASSPDGSSSGPVGEASSTGSGTSSSGAGSGQLSTTSGTVASSGIATTGAGSAGTSTGGAATYAVELERITDQNRHHATMYGGWGPHLRGIMRAPDDTLWFTADVSDDVLLNDGIRYFRRTESGWEEVGTQNHLPGVQQNAGSVMSGRTILTYVVNVGSSNLQECYFDTDDWTYQACNTIVVGAAVHTTPPNANYVGAAIHADGARAVWYTVVGGDGSGQFNYTYNEGSGWLGPVLHTLPGYNTFEYVRAHFVSGTRLLWLGQILTGAYPGGTFDPGVAEVELGQAPAIALLQSGDAEVDARTGADVWVDPQSGDVHAIAQSQGVLSYYFKPAGATWAAHGVAVSHLPDTFRGRFMAPPDRPLALVRGSASGASGVDVLLASPRAGAAIDWDAAIRVAVPAPVDGLDAPSGIYVEGASYQTQGVGDYNFALCGRFEVSDGEIWHGRVVVDDAAR